MGYPLGEVERGRVREGEVGYQLSGRPSNYYIPFGTILVTISTFKNSVEKTMPKMEPKSSPKEAQGCSREDLIDFGTILASIWAPFWEPAAS